MDKLRELLERPLIAAVVGFVVGLVIGLPVLGWGLFPVQWTDASAEHLRRDLKEDYLRMTIESYGKNENQQLALHRWRELGAAASEVLSAVQLDPSLDAEVVADFSALVLGGQVVGTPQAGGIPPVTPVEEKAEGGINPVLLLVMLCLGTLGVGAALFYVLVVRERGRGGNFFTAARHAQQVDRQMPVRDYAGEGQDQPVAQFMTTYMLGDDLYDDSFSIDSQSGEFLGECGVGISETIGVGDPKKVTAFEVWLFDKNDIQTVTKVLMSEHAFNDATINQRLRSKGEPVVIEPGTQVLLETATLQLEARVVDMNYGQGALPTASFFERLTLELAIWPKVGS